MGTSNEAWFGLKLIAACRVQLPDEDVTDELLIDFAKWQVCKSRNIMFKDPIWDDYTSEEVLIEFFGIMFEENREALSEFVNKLKSVDKSTLDWFDRMEAEHVDKIKADQDSGDDEIDEEFDVK